MQVSIGIQIWACCPILLDRQLEHCAATLGRIYLPRAARAADKSRAKQVSLLVHQEVSSGKESQWAPVGGMKNRLCAARCKFEHNTTKIRILTSAHAARGGGAVQIARF